MEVSGSVSRPAPESVWPLGNKMPPQGIVLRFLGRPVMFVSNSTYVIAPYRAVNRK